jgi:DNA-binding transcriptional LysR family regulator
MSIQTIFMKSVSWDFTVDWRKLRLLYELDRRGTIAATATAMYLTPSAVSQQLAGLARDIGAPLLERRGRTVALTGQAGLLLAHAEGMRELAERARAALDAWADGSAGYVRVGSLSTGIAARPPACHLPELKCQGDARPSQNRAYREARAGRWIAAHAIG